MILLHFGTKSNNHKKRSCGFSDHHFLYIGGISCFVHGACSASYYVKSSFRKDLELQHLPLLICGRFRLLPHCALLLWRRAPPRDVHFPCAHPTSSIDGLLSVPGLLPHAMHNRPLLPHHPLSPPPRCTPSVSDVFLT
ncbi:hypothetical protein Ahy_B08g093703 [Arachis hypogaea]|uniref:Uncharacterized protein n=1 Tax=Arachis hypogaea TaxID=3818 RepID=A0A444Y6M8_ARAHY|nr:hypothetical protein Ahy_B08g093703 [Arachis hypogaea]